ncbi:MAG: HNH endonuclease [Chloroflexota bacterium]
MAPDDPTAIGESLPGTPDDERLSALRGVFRSYKRAASRLRDVFDAPDGELATSFNLSSDAGVLTTSFSAGARIPRHAALLRPFMQEGSRIELRSVWRVLQDSSYLDGDVGPRVEAAFEEADRLWPAVNVNGRDLSARDIYTAYGDGTYFREDPKAGGLLKELQGSPMAGMLPMLFHDVCGNFAQLVFVVLEALLDCERRMPVAPPEAADTFRCIYCGSAEGDFGPEEHVIPESLGGDELVITGCVCAQCNNDLSWLDKALIDFEPIALLRVLALPLTKKGKFPKAELPGLVIEKVAPREIRLRDKTGRAVTAPVVQPDGTVGFQAHFTGRKTHSPTILARALFKIGLGLVARDAGREAALDPRFDPAWAFIREGQPVGTHLLMPSKIKPNGRLRTYWQPFDTSTPVVLEIFGVVFAFNLEPVPAVLPPEPLPVPILKFWLGRDNEGFPADEARSGA